jgi:hypothetical protein
MRVPNPAARIKTIGPDIVITISIVDGSVLTMAGPIRVAILVLCAASACGGRKAAEQLRVSDGWVDRAHAPRGEEPLIAGEEIVCGLRISGGRPPFQVQVSLPATTGTTVAFSAETRVTPGPKRSKTIDVGLRSKIPPETRSGMYRLSVTVTDNDGQTVTHLLGTPVAVVGDGAPLREAGDEAAVDIAGRRRAGFFRGEAVTLKPVQTHVPRGAPAGPITLRAVQKDGSTIDADIVVASRPFPPERVLTIDQFNIYGGELLRAPRAAMLERGELVRLEARISGGSKEIAWSAELKASGAEPYRQAFPPAPVEHAREDARTFVQADFRVPNTLPAGRYTLVITAMERNLVTTVQRQVVLL